MDKNTVIWFGQLQVSNIFSIYLVSKTKTQGSSTCTGHPLHEMRLAAHQLRDLSIFQYPEFLFSYSNSLKLSTHSVLCSFIVLIIITHLHSHRNMVPASKKDVPLHLPSFPSFLHLKDGKDPKNCNKGLQLICLYEWYLYPLIPCAHNIPSLSKRKFPSNHKDCIWKYKKEFLAMLFFLLFNTWRRELKLVLLPMSSSASSARPRSSNHSCWLLHVQMRQHMPTTDQHKEPNVLP